MTDHDEAQAKLAALLARFEEAMKEPPTILPAPEVHIEPQRLTTAKPCEIHQTHLPKSHVNEIHHIWPLGEGGPNVAENRVIVCATGHNNIHALLDEYRRFGKTPPMVIRKGFNFAERKLAALGWERITRGAL